MAAKAEKQLCVANKLKNCCLKSHTGKPGRMRHGSVQFTIELRAIGVRRYCHPKIENLAKELGYFL